MAYTGKASACKNGCNINKVTRAPDGEYRGKETKMRYQHDYHCAWFENLGHTPRWEVVSQWQEKESPILSLWCCDRFIWGVTELEKKKCYYAVPAYNYKVCGTEWTTVNMQYAWCPVCRRSVEIDNVARSSRIKNITKWILIKLIAILQILKEKL